MLHVYQLSSPDLHHLRARWAPGRGQSPGWQSSPRQAGRKAHSVAISPVLLLIARMWAAVKLTSSIRLLAENYAWE
jgi:hypothetical protein